MTTIRDVAERAGVGLATVSRVLNGSPLVSEGTRQRVLDIIRDLNYTPHAAARRLSLGKTLTIKVFVPFFPRPSVAERLAGAVSLLSQSEYDLVIHNIETPERRATCFEHLPTRKEVDGVLIISLSPLDHEAEKLVHADIPVVLIDADHPTLTMLHRVTTDDVAGGREAAEHLIQLGHRRIGFIGDSVNNPFGFMSSGHRLQGYQQALAAAGLPVCPDYYAEGEHGRREARDLARGMLLLPERPTAIVAASDTQAVGVLEAARELGLRVPQDLSVIGYDDIEVADMMGLTSMRQRLYEFGQRGVELLLETLDTPDRPPVHEIMPAELVVRQTTAPPEQT